MSRHQNINNERYAPPSSHRCDPPVPITARVVWEVGSEEFVETTKAMGWSGEHVRVYINDPRRTPRTLWLLAEEVERR